MFGDLVELVGKRGAELGDETGIVMVDQEVDSWADLVLFGGDVEEAEEFVHSDLFYEIVKIITYERFRLENCTLLLSLLLLFFVTELYFFQTIVLPPNLIPIHLSEPSL